MGAIAATAGMANLLGIVGGTLVLREPLGNDPVTVIGPLVAFSLAAVAVGLFPAPSRAREAVRKKEVRRVEAEEGKQRRAPTSGEMVTS